MRDRNKVPTIERLNEVLKAYGSRPEKWPEDERAGLEKILAREIVANDALKLEYAEARSMDQLLHSTATENNDDVAQLSAVIMARIAKQKSGQTGAAIIDPGTHNEPDEPTAHPATITPMPVQYSGRPGAWKMAALLAATFVFGIYIGATLIADPAAETVAEFTGSGNTPTAEFTLFESGPGELFEGDL